MRWKIKHLCMRKGPLRDIYITLRYSCTTFRKHYSDERAWNTVVSWKSVVRWYGEYSSDYRTGFDWSWPTTTTSPNINCVGRLQKVGDFIEFLFTFWEHLRHCACFANFGHIRFTKAAHKHNSFAIWLNEMHRALKQYSFFYEINFILFWEVLKKDTRIFTEILMLWSQDIFTPIRVTGMNVKFHKIWW